MENWNELYNRLLSMLHTTRCNELDELLRLARLEENNMILEFVALHRLKDWYKHIDRLKMSPDDNPLNF